MEVAGGAAWRDDSPPPGAHEPLDTTGYAAAILTEEEGDSCRICRGEGTSTQPLFYPCKCSGSIKFVHQDCLMEWLSHSQKKYCELCKTPFRFTKLYDQSMPATIPLPLFLQQVVIHSLRTVSKWVRYVLVGFVWLCWLPWSIRQVWRGLFWLADGSWVSEQDLRQAALAHVAELTLSAGEGLLDASEAAGNYANDSLKDAVVKAVPQAMGQISTFLGLISYEFPFIRFIRLVYPNLFHWPLGFGSPNATEDGLIRDTSVRQPSLLSEVKYIKAISGYPLLDNAMVDILEGQLICLVVITAFILVFLIREWVINQQPILNMPDPDRVEEIAAPAREAEQRARRRRRALRQARHQQLQAQAGDAGNLPDPLPAPVPHRAATEDNMTRSNATGSESVPRLPPRSSSFTLERSHRSAENSSDEAVDEDRILESEFALESRPSLLPRGAFDEAANIRRTIEESSPERIQSPGTVLIDSAPTVEPHDLLFNYPSTSSEGVIEASTDNPDETFLRASDADVTNNTKTEEADARRQSVSSDEVARPSLTVIADSADVIERNSVPSNDSSEDIEPLTTPSTDSGFSDQYADSANNELERPANDPQSDEEIHDAQVDPPPPSVVEIVSAWFWQTEDYVPAAHVIQADIHIVEDLNAEEPFVPAEHPEREVRDRNDNDNDLEPLVVAHAAEANAQFGIDINNPDAVDDAEDLDGILELIGVHGPIAGMIQNVIFSEFLITLTIAASVWLPYIWGKITLLVLANPVGVSVRMPLYLASKSADVAVDLLIFIAGLAGYVFSFGAYAVNLLLKPLLPSVSTILRAPYLQHLSLQFATSSGTRLEKALSLTALGLKPDLPSFSMQSHHALIVFKGWVSEICSINAIDFASATQHGLKRMMKGDFDIYEAYQMAINSPQTAAELYSSVRSTVERLATDLKPLSLSDMAVLDLAAAKWSTQDKAIAIILGYIFFAFLGNMYLKVSRFVLGLKDEEKVEGVVADSLRQAGGVMKVVIIIGIEMIIFPLYCGLLLDVALMPLFRASLQSRTDFMLRTPITGLFVHWFIGTCYMFHFALFVSMCRKIMRKGVLYFIRDPDDPTFHPVRDVLERPVMTQLGKIAFSALIYGGLVLVCLGGVVWTVSLMPGVLPINWAENEPRLAFPIDVIFYNFMLPFIIRKADPSTKISVMYEWWFRGCASGLRLTHFLFGEEKEEEKGTHIRRTWAALLQQKQGDVQDPIIGEERRILAHDREEDAYFYQDGTYVRTPANDTVRIPKGGKVFLEVNDENERLDGKPDPDKGMHGRTDERFTKVYIPPNFRARIATFIFLLWIFAAATGVALTIGPLIIGRKAILFISHSDVPPNDLYALTVGLHVCGAIGYATGYWRVGRQWLTTNTGHCLENLRQALPRLYETAKYVIGLVYLGVTFGVILPFAISVLVEIYVHIPFYSYLNSPSKIADFPPTVYIFQTWTLGLLYFRLALRIATNYPCPHTRVAMAIRAIVRDGWTKPDVRLATRAIVVPASALCMLLFIVPLLAGGLANTALRVSDSDARHAVYRLAFPGLLATGVAVYCGLLLRRQMAVWRVKIRDEVYLIGERLHNFQDVKRSQPSGGAGSRKGKQRARVVVEG